MWVPDDLAGNQNQAPVAANPEEAIAGWLTGVGTTILTEVQHFFNSGGCDEFSNRNLLVIHHPTSIFL